MQIARGSMGEYRAIGESILGECACIANDGCLSAIDYADVLYSFNADKFIYVHTNAFCYNKCKINSALEAALRLQKSEERIKWI
jgi:hypothetical protein